MKSIFPSFIDGDLLKLVHLSNSFKILDGAKQLKAGDVCTSQAKIVSVVNSSEGKTVKVAGQLYHQKAVIEGTAAFLYRGRFTD
jgi:fatty acid synthase subunit alpha, fungi type